MGYISEKINYYQSFGVETPLSIYGTNCLISGGIIDYKLNNNIFDFKISPLVCLIAKKLCKINFFYNISLDCSSFKDNGKILILLHYILNDERLIYRAAYLLPNQKILYPQVTDSNDIDYVGKYPSIILGVFKFEKNQKNQIVKTYNITPDRFNLRTYSNPEEINFENQQLDVLPFDNVSKRISNLILNYTGGSGNTGNTGATGDKGNTGGTGKTGNTGSKGLLSRLTSSKYKVFKQTTPDSIWKIHHNFNELFVQVQTYNQFDKMIQPKEVKLINKNYLEIFFGTAIIGTATLLSGPYSKDRDDIATRIIDIKKDTVDLYELAKKYTGGTGKTGDTGSMGDIGPNGFPGIMGQMGIPGRNGKDGCQGLPGNIGEDGPPGPTGEKGKKGQNGWPGIKGPIGKTGGTGGLGTYDPNFLTYLKNKIDNFICQLYPVGFIYISFVDELPLLLKKCGNWKKLDKVFLYASKEANKTGGLEEVTLVEDEIPIHSLNLLSETTLSPWDSDHSYDVSKGGHVHNLTTDYHFSHNHSNPDNKLTGGNHEHKIPGMTSSTGSCVHIISGNNDYLLETSPSGADHTHKVEMEESGEHTHDIKLSSAIAKGHTHDIISIESAKHTHHVKIDSIGGSKPHNNMPPYITCFMWERVS